MSLTIIENNFIQAQMQISQPVTKEILALAFVQLECSTTSTLSLRTFLLPPSNGLTHAFLGASICLDLIYFLFLGYFQDGRIKKPYLVFCLFRDIAHHNTPAPIPPFFILVVLFCTSSVGLFILNWKLILNLWCQERSWPWTNFHSALPVSSSQCPLGIDCPVPILIWHATQAEHRQFICGKQGKLMCGCFSQYGDCCYRANICSRLLYSGHWRFLLLAFFSSSPFFPVCLKTGKYPW